MKNKIEFNVSPPYPKNKGSMYWGCVMQIKDSSGKINFIEDELYFEVTYPSLKTGKEEGWVKSYMKHSRYKEAEFFNYKIVSDIPTVFIISTRKDIDLSGLYFKLHKLSNFYQS